MAASDSEIVDLVGSMSSSDDEDRLCYSMFYDTPLESTTPYPPWPMRLISRIQLKACPDLSPTTLKLGSCSFNSQVWHFMVPLRGLNQMSGLAAWFASWPGQLFTYASDCTRTALELSVLG